MSSGPTGPTGPTGGDGSIGPAGNQGPHGSDGPTGLVGNSISQQTSQTVAFSGFGGGTVNATVGWQQNGKQVTVSVLPFSGTSDGTAPTSSTAAIPSALWPANVVTHGSAVLNNAVTHYGWLELDTAGVITFALATIVGTRSLTFASGGSSGVASAAILTYLLP